MPRLFAAVLPLLLCLASLGAVTSSCAAADGPRKLVLVAGRPSHPPRMHEFNAGVQLLQKCLQGSPLVETHIVLNGWPQDESIFDGAHAIVFYMDGGKGSASGRCTSVSKWWPTRRASR
jgi:hypothetical protein